MNKKILIVEDEFIIADDLTFILKNAGYIVCGIADSVQEAIEMVGKYYPGLVILDIHLKGRQTGIDLALRLGEMNIAFVYLSANTDQKVLEQAKTTDPYGFWVKPFREKDVLVGLEIAQYLYEQKELARRNNELLLRETLADLFAENYPWRQKFLKMAKLLQVHIPFDHIAIGTKNFDTVPFCGYNLLRQGPNEYQMLDPDEFISTTGIKRQEMKKLQAPLDADHRTAIYNGAEFIKICEHDPEKAVVARVFNMHSNLSVFVPVASHCGYTISFYSRKSYTYYGHHLTLTRRLLEIFALGIRGVLHTATACDDQGARSLPAADVKIIKQTNKTRFDGIVGTSHVLHTALDHLTIVAPMDTAVLILGESGTGKERFAKAVHAASARKNKPLVTVNCAALPTHLIESELFGHEKGAFTGAVDRRIGKFEQAKGGTIFLDEIGELPLESQAKLLRVLQEKEIERLGGRETLKVDVRVIAATNCDLEKQMAAGKFRLDLYYRLNIFPIVLPPLRDRKEDIPELARHFMMRFGERYGKPDMSISQKALNDLLAYRWPGNIRELEHLMERTVLLTRSNIVENIAFANIPNADCQVANIDDTRIKTIDDNERDYILLVLKKCNGRVSGPGGAAELLAVPSTTLNSKMKRLGISRKII